MNCFKGQVGERLLGGLPWLQLGLMVSLAGYEMLTTKLAHAAGSGS